jgi:hypothetical protein
MMTHWWCAFAALPLLVTFSASAQAPESNTKFYKHEKAVPNSFIVVLKAGVTGDMVSVSSQLADWYRVRVTRVYYAALRGFAIDGSERSAIALSQDERVQFVEEDSVLSLAATQSNPPWGLDRTDQRALPLNAQYAYGNIGAGVNVYVIDSGGSPSHRDFFSGRVIITPLDATGGNGLDCNGHGTHVAGTIGGLTYGIAKGVTMHSVRIADCGGFGSTAGIIAGVDWVTINRVLPAVANMSLRISASQALDDAVRNSITTGITYVVAAGNANMDAINFSPARVQEAITVGAVDQMDRRAHFSNFGSVLDLFAPGVDIPSAWTGSNVAFAVASGTSMAAPHVTGVVARILQQQPTATPADVANEVTSLATLNVVVDPGPGSSNRLLYFGSGRLFMPVPPKEDGYFSGRWLGTNSFLGLLRGNCLLKDTNNDGQHDSMHCFGMGSAEAGYFIGDFDGNGTDDVAVLRDNCLHMDFNQDAAADRVQCYGMGRSEDQYFVGKWGPDGIARPAVRRGNCIYKDTNGDNAADIVQCIGTGAAEHQYMAADWNGDGITDIGVRRGSCIYKDINGDNAADSVQCIGAGTPDEVYLTGDWDNNGVDDIGILRGGCVDKDVNGDSIPDMVQCYGYGL